MKKLLTIIGVVTLPLLSQAQNTFFPEIGLQLSNLKIATEGISAKYKVLPTFQIGAGFNFDIGNQFYVKPSLYYSRKGTQLNIHDVEGKIIFNTLELPVQLGYGLALPNNNGKINFEFGPYLSYAMNGHGEMKEGGRSYNEDFNFEDDGYKRFELGLKYSLGYTSKMGIFVRGSYHQGLSNMIYSYKEVGTINNSSFSISLGYNFNLKPKVIIAADKNSENTNK